jgi:threonine synthase
VHGAKVIAVDGNFDAALNIVRDITRDYPVTLVNSINPYRIEGQKTGAFEVCDVLGDAPQFHAIPVGNAGNITAIYKGFREFMKLGITDSLPKMTGIQAEGSCPIVKAIKSGAPEITPEDKPETVASAIRIGNPVNAKKALSAIRETGGTAESVTDEEILAAQRDLARIEGIGVEPASAAWYLIR